MQPHVSAAIHDICVKMIYYGLMNALFFALNITVELYTMALITRTNVQPYYIVCTYQGITAPLMRSVRLQSGSRSTRQVKSFILFVFFTLHSTTVLKA